MSSIFADGSTNTYEAGKAVDGIYLPRPVSELGSIAHAEQDDRKPWWRVNLEQVYCIWAVNVLNRAYVGGHNS